MTPNRSQNKKVVGFHQRDNSDSPAIRRLDHYVEQPQTFNNVPIDVTQVDLKDDPSPKKDATPPATVQELKIPILESSNYNKYVQRISISRNTYHHVWIENNER